MEHRADRQGVREVVRGLCLVAEGKPDETGVVTEGCTGRAERQRRI